MNTEIIYLRPYLRGLPIIILSMVIAVMCAKKYLSYLTPMYQSISKIKLADIQEGTSASNLFKDLDVFATSNKIQGEIEVIMSKEIIIRTLDKIDFRTEISRAGKFKNSELYKERPFFAELSLLNDKLFDRKISVHVLDTSTYEITLPNKQESHEGHFGETLIIDGQLMLLLQLNKTLLDTKKDLLLQDFFYVERLSEQKAYDTVMKNLTVVSTEKDVAVLKIIFKSPVPEKAALFSNKLAEVYIDDYVEIKFQAAKVTSDFLQNQIANVYKKLSESENQIERFKDERNIINLRQETETDLRKIAQLKIQQTNVKMSLEAIEELNDYIQKGKSNFLELAPNFEAFTDLLSTELIKKIKQLQSDKTDLLLIYKEDSEQVKAVNEKIEFHSSYFLESIQNTKNNLTSKYANLSKDIEEAEKSFIGLPQKEKMLVILERDFQLNQSSYMFLNEKKIEADIAKAAKLSFHRIITKASPSRAPVSPNRIIIILVSTILAMFGSILFIFIVHSLKERVYSVSNIEKTSGVPILYTTSRLKNQDKINSHFQKQALTMDMTEKINKKDVIGFTSIKDKHGSTFHATYLAASLKAQGNKVLYISIDQAIDEEKYAFDVISLEAKDFSHFSFEKIQQFLSDCASEYDYTIIKNESLDKHFMSIVFMRLCQLNLFVVDARKTLLKDLHKVDLIKEKSGVDNLHLVFNNDGYNPSVVVEVWKIIKHAIRYIKNRFSHE